MTSGQIDHKRIDLANCIVNAHLSRKLPAMIRYRGKTFQVLSLPSAFLNLVKTKTLSAQHGRFKVQHKYRLE